MGKKRVRGNHCKMKEETKIVTNARKSLNKIKNSFFFKIHGGPMQMAGISDLIGLINGKFIAIEFKTPNNKKGATKLQQWFMKKVNDCGGVAFVARSIDDVYDNFKKYSIDFHHIV